MLLALFVTGCVTDGGTVATDNALPTDPAERLVAEQYISKAQTVPAADMPRGMSFASRTIAGKQISDHFTYTIKELSLTQLVHALSSNNIDRFLTSLKVGACHDPDARFLLGQDYKYNFVVEVLGSKKTDYSRIKITKGFCVAGETPIYNKAAVDDRLRMERTWPNGSPIDPLLVEKLTASFQIVAAKFDTSAHPGRNYKVDRLEADGLMLKTLMTIDLKKNAKLDSLWRQSVKGASLDRLCRSKRSLAAMLVGGIYAYSVDVRSKSTIVDHGDFTVSYSDCVIYNRRPGEQDT